MDVGKLLHLLERHPGFRTTSAGRLRRRSAPPGASRAATCFRSCRHDEQQRRSSRGGSQDGSDAPARCAPVTVGLRPLRLQGLDHGAHLLGVGPRDHQQRVVTLHHDHPGNPHERRHAAPGEDVAPLAVHADHLLLPGGRGLAPTRGRIPRTEVVPARVQGHHLHARGPLHHRVVHGQPGLRPHAPAWPPRRARAPPAPAPGDARSASDRNLDRKPDEDTGIPEMAPGTQEPPGPRQVGLLHEARTGTARPAAGRRAHSSQPKPVAGRSGVTPRQISAPWSARPPPPRHARRRRRRAPSGPSGSSADEGARVCTLHGHAGQRHGGAGVARLRLPAMSRSAPRSGSARRTAGAECRRRHCPDPARRDQPPRAAPGGAGSAGRRRPAAGAASGGSGGSRARSGSRSPGQQHDVQAGDRRH